MNTKVAIRLGKPTALLPTIDRGTVAAIHTAATKWAQKHPNPLNPFRRHVKITK